MKKLIFVILSFVVISFNQAHAYTFKAWTQIYVYPTVATVEVSNQLYRPIVCSGQVTGVTIYGRYLYSYMNHVVIYPGHYTNIYIYTDNDNPFSQVVPNIVCNLL